MPRYRKLHVKTLESLDINDMPDDFTRLFWTLLPLVLCREGRGLDSAHWLKSRLFPLREDVTPGQVGEALNWCMQRGMIVAYSVDGRDYFYVPSFHKYQGNTVKEKESDYPPPPELVQTSSGASPELVESKSATDAVCNTQYSDADAVGNRQQQSDDAAACLQAVHDLGIEEPKASKLVEQAQADGFLVNLVPDLRDWYAHYKFQDGVKNPIGLAITQVESRVTPPTRAGPVGATVGVERVKELPY